MAVYFDYLHILPKYIIIKLFCLGLAFCIQIIFLLQALRHYFPSPSLKPLIKTGVAAACLFLIVGLLWLSVTGRTRFAGRSMTLIDPTYSSKYIPIIASVSEHQPPLWTSFIFDLNLCIFIMPVGLWLVFTEASDTSLFLGIYGLLSVYFSCEKRSFLTFSNEHLQFVTDINDDSFFLSFSGFAFYFFSFLHLASFLFIKLNQRLLVSHQFFSVQYCCSSGRTRVSFLPSSIAM